MATWNVVVPKVLMREEVRVSRGPVEAPTGPREGSAVAAGEFVVQVFGQGEPGSSRAEITGTLLHRTLGGAQRNTRGGYTRGNVQLRGSSTRPAASLHKPLPSVR